MTYFSHLSTCRFCHEFDPCHEMVRYGTRHYAHFDCYLSAGKPFDTLTPWQIGQFPYLILRKHGLVGKAEEIRAKAKDKAA